MVDNIKRRVWVSSMRTRYRKDGLVPDRIRLLESINGWVWDKFEEDFQYGLSQFKKYVREEKSTHVPNKHIDDDGFSLGGWLYSRRRDYKKGTLSEERIKLLEAVQGWLW